MLFARSSTSCYCRVLAMIVLPLLAVSSFAQAPNATGEPQTLRILSYNIHHAEGVDGKLDLERIAEVIRSTQPDIVAVQEVDRLVKRSRAVDQPAELGKLLQMEFVFGDNIELQGGHYGNLLLSRFPIVTSKNHRIPSYDNGEQRGVLDAMLKLPMGNLRVLATHFDHRRDPAERLASIEMVNGLVANSTAPTLFCGDLNAEFDSPVLDRARTHWSLSNKKRLPTIPVGKPERQIDFVLYRPADAWNVQEVQVLDEAIASDHRPILAVLRWNHRTP